jgi:hypothetical protein
MLWRNSRGRPLNAPAAFIHPCQPTVAKEPPSGPGWVYELKHDGYRLQIRYARSLGRRRGRRNRFRLAPSKLSMGTLRGYVRNAEIFQDHAGAGILTNQLYNRDRSRGSIDGSKAEQHTRLPRISLCNASTRDGSFAKQSPVYRTTI